MAKEREAVPHEVWVEPRFCGKRWGPRLLSKEHREVLGLVTSKVFEQMAKERGDEGEPVHLCNLHPLHRGPHRCFQRAGERPCLAELERAKEEGL